MSLVIQFVMPPLDVPAGAIHELLAARQRERRLLWHLRRTVRDAVRETFPTSVVHLWLDDVVDVVEIDPDAWSHWRCCCEKLRRKFTPDADEIFLCEKAAVQGVLDALHDYAAALRDMTEFEAREWQRQTGRRAA